jgi:hypothetical protein
MNFIGKCRPTLNREREPINIDPDVRQRMRELLYEDEFHAVGYSAFINRACEIAETEIVEARRMTNESKADPESIEIPPHVLKLVETFFDTPRWWWV